MSRTLLQQAYLALKSAANKDGNFQDYKDVADAIEQELAKPEQEPVAWKYDWYGYKSQNETKVLVKDWIASVYSEVSDPTIGAHNIRPLYTTPPRKEWVGLTSEDWENTPDTGKVGCERDAELFDWIEQTLKDKNDTL